MSEDLKTMANRIRDFRAERDEAVRAGIPGAQFLYPDYAQTDAEIIEHLAYCDAQERLIDEFRANGVAALHRNIARAGLVQGQIVTAKGYGWHADVAPGSQVIPLEGQAWRVSVAGWDDGRLAVTLTPTDGGSYATAWVDQIDGATPVSPLAE